MHLKREQIAGLDVGDGYLAAAHWRSRAGHGLRLRRGATLPYEPSGDRVHHLARQIRALWRLSGIRTTSVNVVVRPPSLLLKLFDYDNIALADLEPALRLEAEATLQIQPDQIAYDFHLFNQNGKVGNEAGRAMSGLLAATPKDEIEPVIDAVRRAGLFPVSAEVGVLPLANLAIASTPPPAGEVSCFILASRQTVDLAVLEGGSAHIYPGSFFTRSLDPQRAQTYLVENIVDHLKYYHVKLRRNPVRRILLSGPGEMAKPLREQLRQRLNLPVESWAPLQDAMHGARLRGKNGDAPDPSLLAGAAGAALRMFE